MSTNGDITPRPETIIKHAENREIVTFLANLIVEARQQVISLDALYTLIRDLSTPAPRMWGHQLVESQEAHVKRVQAHIAGVKIALG